MFQPSQISITNSNIKSNLPELSLLHIVEQHLEESKEQVDNTNTNIYISYR